MRLNRALMPLEGCLQSRGGWRRLIQGRKESGMVNPLEFSALVGIDHRTGRLVGRLVGAVARMGTAALVRPLWEMASMGNHLLFTPPAVRTCCSGHVGSPCAAARASRRASW